MSSATAEDLSSTTSSNKVSVFAEQPSVLTDIYRDEVNIVVWQNQLTPVLINEAETLVSELPNLKVVMIAQPDFLVQNLVEEYPELAQRKALCQHIGLLVDMFSTLFEQERVGLRLTSLNRAMCPKFHVDHVPCRLVSTLSGVATQWLPHHAVNRTKLGAGSNGLADEESGLFVSLSDIQQLNTGDVALLKGSGWFNNEEAGLVHRSPAVYNDEKRLLLTLDFAH